MVHRALVLINPNKDGLKWRLVHVDANTHMDKETASKVIDRISLSFNLANGPSLTLSSRS